MTGRMRTKMAGGLFWCCLLMWLAPLTAQAKLTILPPDIMLEQADVIAVGTVVKLEDVGGEQDKTGKIRIDSVLKGSLNEDTLSLRETHYMQAGSWLQRIPPAGTNVLLLLKKDGNGKPGYFADANHIGVIENGHVTDVYKGTNLSVHPYVETYDAYYQQHKEQAVMIAKLVQPPAEVAGGFAAPVQPVPEVADSGWLKFGLTTAAGIAVVCLIGYDLRKRRARRK